MKRLLILDNELYERYLLQLCEIDRASFGSEPTPQAMQWAKAKPWMYYVLRAGEEVIGYTLVMPLREVAFNAMKKGELWENRLQVSDVADSDPKGFYVASIAASNRMLRYSFVVGTLCGILLGELGRCSKPVIAVPITRTGQKLAEILGMSPIPSELRITGVGGYLPRVFYKPEYEKNTPLNIGN